MGGHPIDIFLSAWARISRTDGYDLRLRVYEALGLGGRWDRDRLRVTLRALLVHRTEDWDRFEQEFNAFFPEPEAEAAEDPIEIRPPDSDAARPKAEHSSQTFEVPRHRTFALLAAVVGFGVALAIGVLLLQSSPDHGGDGPELSDLAKSSTSDLGAFDPSTPARLGQALPQIPQHPLTQDLGTQTSARPTPPETVTVPIISSHRRDALGFWAGAVLMLIALCVVGWFLWPRRNADSPEFAEELDYRSGVPPTPMTHRELDRLAYLTGLSLAADHRVLDELATVQASARQAGVLLPVYRSLRQVGLLRVVIPESIDAVTSALVLSLVRGLRERGVPVTLFQGLPTGADEPELILLIVNAALSTHDSRSPWLTEWLKLPHVGVIEARDPSLWGEEVAQLPVGAFPPNAAGIADALLCAAADLRPRPVSVPRRGPSARGAKALPLLAACAIASPCDLATADELRRRFTPNLHFSILQRILYLDGVTPDPSGWCFTPYLQAQLAEQAGPTFTRRILMWQEQRLHAIAVRQGTRAAFMRERELALLRLQLAVGCAEDVVDSEDLSPVLRALEPQLVDPRLARRLRERIRAVAVRLPVFQVRKHGLRRRLRRLGIHCEVVESHPKWQRWALSAVAIALVLGGGLLYVDWHDNVEHGEPDLREAVDLRMAQSDLAAIPDLLTPQIPDLLVPVDASHVEQPDMRKVAPLRRPSDLGHLDASHAEQPELSEATLFRKPPDLGHREPDARPAAGAIPPIAAPTEVLGASRSVQLERGLKLYDSEDYYLASIELGKVAEGQTGDSEADRQRAEFFVGKTLFNLKYYAASLSYFFKIVRKGQSHRYYQKTLQWLASLARFMPDTAGILDQIDKYNLQDLEQPALDPVRNELFYLLARRHYGKRNLREAVKTLSMIPVQSDFFERAKILEGVTYARDNQVKQAAEAFRQVLRKAKTGDKAALAYEGLARINLARIFYSTAQYSAAIKIYGRVPKRAAEFPSALLESAWANYRNDSLEKALEQLVALKKLSDRATLMVIIESLLLRAIVHYERCEPEKARLALKEFEQDYAPLRDELLGILKKYPDNSEFQKYVQMIPRGRTGLSQRLQRAAAETLSVRSLDKMAAHITELDRELTVVDRADPIWKLAAIAGTVLQDLTLQRAIAANEAGSAARTHLEQLASEIYEMNKQAVRIAYELTRMEEASSGGRCKYPEPEKFPPGVPN